MDFHIYFHFPPSSNALENLAAKLEVMDAKLNSILGDMTKMALSFDALTAQVKADTDIENAAVTAINGLIAQVAALQVPDPASQAIIDQAVSDMKASSSALSAAIPANTSPAPSA